MIARACYVTCDRCGNPAEVVTGGAKEARSVAASTERFARIDGKDVCGNCRDAEAGFPICAVCGGDKSDLGAHYPWGRCNASDQPAARPTISPPAATEGSEVER